MKVMVLSRDGSVVVNIILNCERVKRVVVFFFFLGFKDNLMENVIKKLEQEL